ncbi:TonB-dependent receptor [Glaciecola sp. 2405UD65-10]|uniref:TonB-dependent receptor n=1 Tax=Glaciecola sp. 2405UD65-10 TaxID=3397244 RepID=UPI003B5CF821
MQRASRFSLISASIALALTHQSSFVNAQESAQATNETEVITVTGTRLQNQRAALLKYNSENIIDAISADEIGALPDFSVAEAISRITGVSTEDRNGDAEFVVIRGMRSDFNYLSIDGAIVPSTRRNGRATQLSVIPSSVIDTTSVAKSFSANMDANAIGGNINVRTRSAFDYDTTYFFARGALGKYDHDESPADAGLSSRANLTYANSFGKDGAFGVVFSAGHLLSSGDTWLPGVAYNEYRVIGERVNDANETEQYTTRLYEDGMADSIEIPHGNQTYQYNNEIERNGALLKLEYRNNSDSLYLNLSSYIFTENDTEKRWDSLIFRSNENAIPENLTATSGFVDSARTQRQYFLQGDKNTLKSMTFNAQYQINDEQDIAFLASKASGERENPFYQIRFEADDRSAFAYEYDSSGDYPIINLSTPSNWTNTELFTPVFYRDRFDINEQDASQVKVDFTSNWQAANKLGIKLGASTRTDERFQDQLFDYDYRPNSDAVNEYTLTNTLSDDTNYFSPNLVPGQPQQFINPDLFLQYFADTKNEWDDTKNQINEGLSSQFVVEETINAAYVMGRYSLSNVTLIGGLRYEDTDVKSTGGQRLGDDDPSTPEYVLNSQSGGYSKLLPSIIANYQLSDNMKVRAAYSETLGRAEYDDLAVRGSRNIDDTNQSISISSGNTNLKPREAQNIDLSFDYAVPESGVAISAGLFHKSIANEIYNRKEIETLTINGLEYTQTTTQPTNANTVKLKGLEAGVLLNSFDFISNDLEDVGFSANYSYIDSQFNIETNDDNERELFGLFYQPKEIANMKLFWSPSRFDIRLALRYKGKRQVSASASSESYDEFIASQTFVDLRVKYKFKNGLNVSIEGRNLSNEAEHQMLNSNRIHWTRDYGKSFWVGAAYRF